MISLKLNKNLVKLIIVIYNIKSIFYQAEIVNYDNDYNCSNRKISNYH
jgi:hypothetical protein